MLFGDAYAERQGTPPPPRPPTALPNPGNLALRLGLGAQLGRGGSGRVYEAVVVPGGSSSLFAATPSVLPPLVVKISRRGRARKLANEAYYYDLCHSLQGVSLARFYGHFRTELPHGIQLPHLDDDDESDESSEDTSEPSSHESSGSDDAKQPTTPSDDGATSGDRFGDKIIWSWNDCDSTPPEAPPHPEDSDIEEIETGPDSVSILVMERLGGFLPISEKLPDMLLYVRVSVFVFSCTHSMVPS